MPRKTKETIEKTETKKTAKKVDSKKTTTKKDSVAKTKKTTTNKTTIKKTTTSTSRKKTNIKKFVDNLEYYDLPYSYNETIVKLLAQTPKTLFVYWEVSSIDREKFVKEYGNDFFNNTIPVLSIYNETKNYFFNIVINDYANSWYIHVPDEACKYTVKLRRIFKEEDIQMPSKYIEISSSNEIIIPNGHALINSSPNKIEYINLKTNAKYFRDVCYHKNSHFYNEVTSKFDLDNPSSNFHNF